MARPRALKDQEEKAKKLRADVYGKEDNPAEDQPSVGVEETPGQQTKLEGTETPEKPAETPEVLSPTPEPEVPTQTVEAPPVTVEELQKKIAEKDHKHDVLKGKYDSEVPKLKTDSNILQLENEELRKQIIDTKSAEIAPGAEGVVTPTKEAPKPQIEADALITDQMRENWGEDSLKELSAIARREVLLSLPGQIGEHPVIKKLVQDVESLTSQTTHIRERQGLTDGDKFENELTALVSNWRSINEMPEWKAWLVNREPITGIQWDTIIQDAIQNYDAKRVALVVEKFIQEANLQIPVVPPVTPVPPGVPPESSVAVAEPLAGQETIPASKAEAEIVSPAPEGTYDPAKFRALEEAFRNKKITYEQFNTEYNKLRESAVKAYGIRIGVSPT